MHPFSSGYLLNQTTLERIYRSLYRIRLVEEEIIRLYPTDKIKSPVHLSIGQETVSVGVCEALKQNDVAFGNYRGHALYLAKGGNLNLMMAELFGKVDGCARGKAGSMHLVAPSVNMMGTSAIVATGISNAVGYAQALKMKKSDAVVAVFFGEGAIDEGAFHESLNFAALKSLPILFICENNSYAIYSNVRDRMPEVNICERAEVYRIPAKRIEDGDVFAIRENSIHAVQEIRAGNGPQFLECMTFRWRDHVGPDEDRNLGYRPDEELDSWIERDQIPLIAAKLDDITRSEIEKTVEEEIASSIEFAEQSPFPMDDEIHLNVFSQ